MRRWGRLARSLSHGDPVPKLPDAPKCDGQGNFGDFDTIGTGGPLSQEQTSGHSGNFGTAPSAWDEDDWHAAQEERAAILEFDGGWSRAAAERLAAEEIAAMRRTLH